MHTHLGCLSFVRALCSAGVVACVVAGCQGVTKEGSSSPSQGADGGEGHTAPQTKEAGADDLGSDGGNLTLADASVDGTSEDASVAPAADAAVAPPPPIVGSAGCGGEGVPADGLQTIQVNGKSRTYIVHVPKVYDGRTPYPLLFGFHGATRTAGDFDNDKGTFRFGPALGDRTILVYPNALSKAGGGTTWSRDTDDDLGFFDAMLAKLSAELCVNPGRVYATGHSSGGYFSNTLGCRRGDVLRAIAPVAGGVRDFTSCKGEVAVWMAHGTKDNQVNISQGQAAREHWVEANACSKEPPPSAVSPSPCVAHAGCRAGYPVHWCAHDQPTYGNPPTYHGWPDFATAGITAFLEALAP